MSLVKCDACGGRGDYLNGLPPDTEDCPFCGGHGYTEEHDLEYFTEGDDWHQEQIAAEMETNRPPLDEIPAVDPDDGMPF